MLDHGLLAELSVDAYREMTFVYREVELLYRVIDGHQVLAVAGTEGIEDGGLRDIARDLFAVPAKFDEFGWAHAGFGLGATGLLEETALVSGLIPDLPIVCTGHSMGGIISAMLAQALHRRGWPVVQWTGFAAPRGFLGARDWGRIQLTNYCYGHDPVPQYMPLGLLYSHPVSLARIGVKTTYFTNPKDRKLVNYVTALNLSRILDT
jgi:hypothetical protein